MLCWGVVAPHRQDAGVGQLILVSIGRLWGLHLQMPRWVGAAFVCLSRLQSGHSYNVTYAEYLQHVACTSTSWLGSAAQSKDAHCWKAGVVACLWWHPTTDAGLVQLVIGIMEQIVVIALWVGVATCYEAGNNVTMTLMVHHHVVICGKLVGGVVDAA